jgi:plasmid stabilization system protein ParE
MAYRLIWSPAARADVDEIEARIVATGNPVSARRVVERMWEAMHNQCDFPYSARMIPEFEDPTRRETFVHEWRLMYRIKGSRVRVMRVVHGRRLLKNVPGSFEEPPAEYTAA